MDIVERSTIKMLFGKYLSPDEILTKIRYPGVGCRIIPKSSYQTRISLALTEKGWKVHYDTLDVAWTSIAAMLKTKYGEHNWEDIFGRHAYTFGFNNQMEVMGIRQLDYTGEVPSIVEFREVLKDTPFVMASTIVTTDAYTTMRALTSQYLIGEPEQNFGIYIDDLPGVYMSASCFMPLLLKSVDQRYKTMLAVAEKEKEKWRIFLHWLHVKYQIPTVNFNAFTTCDMWKRLR